MNRIVRAVLNRLLGNQGEQAAAHYLRKHHRFRILVRGYRTTWGEIDLIARDGNTLVFVEVKARRQGTPVEAITLEKQRRLTLTALHFLKRHRLLEQRCRFDVVAILWPEDRTAPHIEYIHDAFPAVGSGQMFR